MQNKSHSRIVFTANSIVAALQNTGGGYSNSYDLIESGNKTPLDFLSEHIGQIQTLNLEDLQQIKSAFAVRYKSIIEYNNGINKSHEVNSDKCQQVKAVTQKIAEQIQILSSKYYKGDNQHFAWDRCDNESQLFDKGFLAFPSKSQIKEELRKEQTQQSRLERLSCRSNAKSNKVSSSISQ